MPRIRWCGICMVTVVMQLGFFVFTRAAAPYQKIVIQGETAAQGVFDCSVEYTADGSAGYMVYSACDNWPVNIHTHLAKTTNHGLTWSYVQAINISTADTINLSGVMTDGTWHHEVPSLVHDPDDPGKEWKLYWHRYFSKAPHDPAADSVWAYGWIGYKYASDPEGIWSGEIPLFGAGVFPPSPYTVQMNLNTANSVLNHKLVYTEPGSLYNNGTLYLALQGNSAILDEQILFLLKSSDHGANWIFVDILANSQTAKALGYDYFTAPSLVAENNRYFLFVSPGRLALPDHAGTTIVEFENIETADLQVDSNRVLEVFKYLAPSITTINAGESDYDAYNYNGGIVMPQLQLTPNLEFQLWCTGERLLPPLALTPTPTATATPAFIYTPTPTSSEVLAYPNPSQELVNFLVPGESGTEVIIDIYNLAGEKISQMVQVLGRNSRIAWECRTVAPGIYLARIRVAGEEKAKIKVGVIKR